jgi:hypothetical protein
MVTSSRLTWLVLEVMELQRLSFQRETLETSDICSPPVQCTQLLARVSFFRVRTCKASTLDNILIAVWFIFV